ncbi:hypothetical protein GCM10028833_38180 [Glycomyces tarimensis]
MPLGLPSGAQESVVYVGLGYIVLRVIVTLIINAGRTGVYFGVGASDAGRRPAADGTVPAWGAGSVRAGASALGALAGAAAGAQLDAALAEKPVHEAVGASYG